MTAIIILYYKANFEACDAIVHARRKTLIIDISWSHLRRWNSTWGVIGRQQQIYLKNANVYYLYSSCAPLGHFSGALCLSHAHLKTPLCWVEEMILCLWFISKSWDIQINASNGHLWTRVLAGWGQPSRLSWGSLSRLSDCGSQMNRHHQVFHPPTNPTAK